MNAEFVKLLQTRKFGEDPSSISSDLIVHCSMMKNIITNKEN